MTDDSKVAEERRCVGDVEMTGLGRFMPNVYVCLESYEPVARKGYSMFQVAINSTRAGVWEYRLSSELVSSYNSLVAAGAHQK